MLKNSKSKKFVREKKKELHSCNTFWVLHEISIQIEPLSLILEHGSPSIKAKTPSKIRIATKHSPPYESRWKNFTNDLCSYIKSPFFLLGPTQCVNTGPNRPDLPVDNNLVSSLFNLVSLHIWECVFLLAGCDRAWRMYKAFGIAIKGFLKVWLVTYI